MVQLHAPSSSASNPAGTLPVCPGLRVFNSESRDLKNALAVKLNVPKARHGGQ